ETAPPGLWCELALRRALGGELGIGRLFRLGEPFLGALGGGMRLTELGTEPLVLRARTAELSTEAVAGGPRLRQLGLESLDGIPSARELRLELGPAALARRGHGRCIRRLRR